MSLSVAHACAIAATGTAFCWGANNFGELGNGTTRNSLKEQVIAGIQGEEGFSWSMPRPSSRTVVLIGMLLAVAGAAFAIFRPRHA